MVLKIVLMPRLGWVIYLLGQQWQSSETIEMKRLPDLYFPFPVTDPIIFPVQGRIWQLWILWARWEDCISR